MCYIRGANFNRSKRLKLKWLHNRLVNLNVDLKLARNEESHERVTALEIEIDVMTVDKNVLESQTEKQRVAAYALEEAHTEKKEAEEAQRVAKAAAKAAGRDAKWTAEVDASIECMLNGGDTFKKIASKLGNGLKENDIKNRWYVHLKKSSSIIKPAVPGGFPSRFTWTADVDATIVRMRADDISFPKIASELGNGLSTNDISNRWNRFLKDKRSE
jgi:hypothetical protein